MFLGSHHRHPPGMVVHVEEGGVGELVQFLYLLALDIGRAGAAQDLGQPGPVGLAGDDLAGQGDVIQQGCQRTGCRGKGALLLQDVPFDRDDLPGLLGFISHACLLACQ